MATSTCPHSLTYCNNLLTVNGVVKVLEISEKQATLKLAQSTLTVKGSGLNVVKLEREQGIVQMEAQGVQSITYRAGILKGLL